MDMRVRIAVVREQRQQRAWSQEQLATAAGLGVRTIQRLESSGVASNESAKALAAVFSIPLQDLVVAPEVAAPQPRRWKRHAAVAAAVSCAALSAALMITRASAGEILLNVMLGTNGAKPSTMSLRTEDGKQAEIRLENEIRIVLTPKIQQGDVILLSAELYTFEGGQYSLASRPELLARSGSDTKLALSLGSNKTVELDIVPKIL